MKNQVLNNIDDNIKILKNITIDSENHTYWELNVLLDKHYAMRNLIIEDGNINYEKVYIFILDLEKEIANFLPSELAKVNSI